MIIIMSPDLEPHLRDLRHHGLTFERGQYLFHVGDPVHVMHFVRTGLVRLVRIQNDGSELVLQRAPPGSILAEASFCSDLYHCDAIAAEETHTVACAVTEFHARLRSTPEFAEAWARHLAHELQAARLQAEILSLKTVARRLDAWIAWRGGTLPRKGEWQRIASEIGVTPEALYREIAKRRSSGQSKNRHGEPLPA